MDILMLIGGLVLILLGANALTDGAAALAKRFGISELVIGLTIVAFGTSAPELTVSVASALSGSADMAVGNVVGSNLFNTLMIVGCTALFAPILMTRSNLLKEIPLCILASVVLFICANDSLLDGTGRNQLSHADGLLLLCFFVIFVSYTFAIAHKPSELAPSPQGEENPAPGEEISASIEKDSSSAEGTKTSSQTGSASLSEGKGSSSSSEKGLSQTGEASSSENEIRSLPLWQSILYIIGGLAALIYGGSFFVDGASGIARSLGVSDAIIGLTIVAGGTSLPELATSIVAALKKNPEIAIGNVIGSNLFNIFFVLGCTATISPLSIQGINNTDLLALLGAGLLLWIFGVFFGRRIITRTEGAILALCYVAYTVYLIMQI